MIASFLTASKMAPVRGAAKALCAGAAALALASCASLSKDECLTANWTQIGEIDGARGRDAGYVSQHAEACAKVGVVPDLRAWNSGRDAGLLRYCTPDNAYAQAAAGGALNPVCGGFEQAALARADAEGRQVWRARERQREIERAIDRREREIAALSARADKDPKAAEQIRRLRRDINRLERDALLGGIGRGAGSFLFLRF